MAATQTMGHRILPSDSLALKSSFKCYAGEAITKNQIVCVVGRQGKMFKVEKASSTTAADAPGLLMVAEHTAAAGRFVRCKPMGAIEDQNTNGLTVGDRVYLSSTAGGWSTSKTGFLRAVGTVAVVSATVGVIAFNGQSDSGERTLSGSAATTNGQATVTIAAATLGGAYGGKVVTATAGTCTNAVYVVKAAWSTDDLVITLSGDPGATGIVYFRITVAG